MTDRTIAEFSEELRTIAPFDKAASWDPVGLQFGDPRQPVRQTAVCHEVTDPVVDALQEAPVDLLVSYHPLLFEPTTRLVVGRSAPGRAHRLIRAGVALAVVHTAFDIAPGGAADALAEALSLSEIREIGPLAGRDAAKVVAFVPPDRVDSITRAMAEAGAGSIGNYESCSFRTSGRGTFFAGRGTSPVAGSEGKLNVEEEIRVEMVAPRSRTDAVVEALVRAHPYEEPAFDVYEVRANDGLSGRAGNLPGPMPVPELATLVSDALGGVLRVAPAGPDPVQSVAVVPGSGSSLISAAAGAAEALVTGDVGHHRARTAIDLGLAIIDPGHAATERPGVAKLYSAVAAMGPCLDLTALDTGPWEEPA